jgi:CheY-like chemotaxis protein
MKTTDPRHHIEEIRADIERMDLLKARLVIDDLDRLAAPGQAKVLLEVSRAPDGFALPILAYILSAHPGVGREHPGAGRSFMQRILDAPKTVTALLQGPTFPGREELVRTLGQVGPEWAASPLSALLENDPDEAEAGAALEALGRVGQAGSVSAISRFLDHDRPDLVAAAAHAIGRIATPTALDRLAGKLGRDPELDVLILEIFADNQDPLSLRKLVGALTADSGVARNHARTRLAEIGAKVVPMLEENLLYDDPDLLVMTLNVLGEIGDASAVGPIRRLLSRGPDDPNVRFAAFEALGLLPVEQGAFALARGMADPDPSVRVAAARAVEHGLGPALAAGIRNLVAEKDEDAGLIAQSVVAAQADKLFLELVDEPFFLEYAGAYLRGRAHPDLRRHFQELLATHGPSDAARALAGPGSAGQERPVAVAVDDSRMILSIYKNVLFELGFSPLLFDSPAQALRHVRDNRPAVVFTDLNMPDITGLELAAGIRQLHPPEALPIVLVTTQSDARSQEEATKAGVTAFLHKPFDAQKLAAAMAEAGVPNPGRAASG